MFPQQTLAPVLYSIIFYSIHWRWILLSLLLFPVYFEILFINYDDIVCTIIVLWWYIVSHVIIY